jgi:hypothetical protein
MLAMARRMRSPKTRAQIRRAVAERRANATAVERGEPLPYPNIWDQLDPTKLPGDASEQEILESIAAFSKLCPPPARKRHYL